MSEPKRFAEGIYFALPREGAREFVLGSISVKADPFVEWLNAEERNTAGYVNFDILMSKAGKPYIIVNDYRAKKTDAQPAAQAVAPKEPGEPAPTGDDPF